MQTEVVSSFHLCSIIYFLLGETIYTTFNAFVTYIYIYFVQTSTNVKMDKPITVTDMQFAITPKDHTVAIANKGSLVMDSIAPVRIQIKRERCMLKLCSS